ncbi:MAG: AAA family ATPase [Proteobacteria bacterium]|nr:AAA family ATPase [Pseudomonadota bacterium]
MKRYSEDAIKRDLKEKMVFVGGPRQVGKTTLALHALGNAKEDHPAYLNWDVIHAKKMLLNGELPSDEKLIILDEIHKFKDWRNLVKGFFDQYKSKRSFIITGSARLDHYRRGGDSLQGRYHYHRLHPITLYELNKSCKPGDVELLLKFGGFPEPFIKGEERFWKRWVRERQSRIIQEDLVSLETVKEVSQLDLLAQILPQKVGSLLSINSLRQDLKVAFETAERYVQILENLYHCYRIKPFGTSHLRTAKKEKKLYLWDWSQCESGGIQFENLVASHLLKYCHYIEDTEGDDMELNFLRDHSRREIDFIVVKNKKPLFAVECKSSDQAVSKHISYFADRTDIPYFYQVHSGKRDYEVGGIRTRVLPFHAFCQKFKL